MNGYRMLTARSAAEAYVLVGALQAEGFDVALTRDALGSIYGLTSGPFATRVMVAVEDFAAARAFLSAIEG